LGRQSEIVVCEPSMVTILGEMKCNPGG